MLVLVILSGKLLFSFTLVVDIKSNFRVSTPALKEIKTITYNVFLSNNLGADALLFQMCMLKCYNYHR